MGRLRACQSCCALYDLDPVLWLAVTSPLLRRLLDVLISGVVLSGWITLPSGAAVSLPTVVQRGLIPRGKCFGPVTGSLQRIDQRSQVLAQGGP